MIAVMIVRSARYTQRMYHIIPGICLPLRSPCPLLAPDRSRGAAASSLHLDVNNRSQGSTAQRRRNTLLWPLPLCTRGTTTTAAAAAAASSLHLGVNNRSQGSTAQRGRVTLLWPLPLCTRGTTTTAAAAAMYTDGNLHVRTIIRLGSWFFRRFCCRGRGPGHGV